MNKLLVICGPTATGKTDLAIQLARQFNGELISADSRQVYKGMDIGTGKDLEKNSKLKTQNSKLQIKNKKYSVGYYLKDKTPLWLLDVVKPEYNFNVAEYEALVWVVIKDVWKRRKLPILVGGTGLYIKAIIEGIGTTGIPQDTKLRDELGKMSLENLQKKLQDLDPKKWASMNNSDRNNPRRLVRAIEITVYKKNNLLFEQHREQINADTLMIGLTAPKEILYQRIDERVEKRVIEGMENEIKTLLKKGYKWDLPSMSAMGYRIWEDYFDNKATLEETVQKWKYQEHDYARRQLTWFKKDKRILWFDIEDKKNKSKIIARVEMWLK